MWYLGDFLGAPKNGSKTEWLSQTGLPRHPDILVSLTLSNVVVENFIRIWLAVTVENHRVAHYRMGEAVGPCLGVFYDDDSMVVSRDSE